jgi:hypothetical protein
MQKHLEFQVVTPRTLAEFQGKTLVLPNVRMLSDEEKLWLRKYVDGGRTLVITGEDTTGLGAAQNVVRFSKCPGAEYFAALNKDFAATSPDQEKVFLEKLQPSSSLRVLASAAIATSIAQVEGTPHVFFANFAGLRGGVNPLQTPQTNVRVEITGTSQARGYFLPFLGEVSKVDGVAANGEVTFTLPAIEKGAVFWWDETDQNQMH